MALACHVVEELLLSTLRRYVAATQCDCILLSGGIDTSVVALAASLEGVRLTAITAYYVGGVPRDLPYAAYTARVLGLRHILIPVDDEYIASRARFITRCTGRRDYIEVRNDVVFLRGLEEAKRLCSCVYLGDGGDEVFAGYGFMLQLGSGDLLEAVKRYIVRGRYPGMELADCIGLEAHAPLLSDAVVELVLAAGPHCLREDCYTGKLLLRGILRRHGLAIVADRPKTPAEAGAGTDGLTRPVLEGLAGIELDEEHA